jgi:chloramphenicol 3-O phosphotransferase
MIIFLNGCGSSGKTSIAKSIQHLSDEPWIRLGVDTLIDMLPSRYMGFGDKSQDGYFSFVEDKNSQGPTMRVKMTPQGQAIFRLLTPLC